VENVNSMLHILPFGFSAAMYLADGGGVMRTGGWGG
jgi:hypothetical protein